MSAILRLLQLGLQFSRHYCTQQARLRVCVLAHTFRALPEPVQNASSYYGTFLVQLEQLHCEINHRRWC